MTSDDAAATSRRARRVQTGEVPIPSGESDASESVLTLEPESVPATTSTGSLAAPATPVADTEPAADIVDTAPVAVTPRDDAPTIVTAPDEETAAEAAADEPAPITEERPLALAWVDEGAVAMPGTPVSLTAAASPYIPVEADLLAHVPHRSPLRAGVIVPAVIIAGLVGSYAATTLLWPLHAVAPTVSAIEVRPVAAPAAALPWPADGSAAVSVGGIAGAEASAADPQSIASITKVVTALIVLDEMPLEVGEQGPEYRFDYEDSAEYWNYLANGESALDVPVGGSLSQYQMLQGMLIGSANNYADRLSSTLFPSNAVFADAAMSWLSAHGVPGVRIVEPTGIDSRNRATPEALLALGEKALANPVIAEIVATKSVKLPGAGTVKNTNRLLADPGVVGIKTGTLDAWNVLSAKDIVVGETPVRMYASVLGQPDDTARIKASRALYKELEQELQLAPSVTAGTLAGTVETAWGDRADIITAADASVVLWDGGTGTVTTTYELGDERAEGGAVGSLSVDGPLDAATVDLRLADDIVDPSAWWRLTHPLELFGLTD